MDPKFRVDVLSQTVHPQTLIWFALHQDYSENYVFNEDPPSETKAGDVIVKRLLSGDRGHYGCYSSDTEVLTSQGWTPWPEVTRTHKLAAVELNSWDIKFETPTALQKVALDPGDYLYSVQTSRFDWAVTLDHRMVFSTRLNSKGEWSSYKFGPASSLVGKPFKCRLAGNLTDRKIPADCPKDVDLISLFKLAGFFFGDGLRSNNINPGCLRFRLRRNRKINFLYTLGFPISVGKADRYVIHNTTVSAWIHKYFASSTGKTIPRFLLELPSALFEAFAEGLRNSDGTLRRNTWALDSTEKEALDILQAAFHLNNTAATLSLNNKCEGPDHENHRPCWRLHVSSLQPESRIELTQKNRTRGEEKLISYDGFVYCATVSTGALLVRRNNKVFISGNCLEHPAITFSCGYFPHSVMQQARTHRVAVSFDVQSMRYTGHRVSQVADGLIPIEDVFYLRPVGTYSDRQGKKYTYTEEHRSEDLRLCKAAAERYCHMVRYLGHAEEHARGILPFDFRQHFVVTFSLRSFLHFMDLRSKLDAQEEIRNLCDLMWPHFQSWAPEIAAWYEKTRLHKARLAP